MPRYIEELVAQQVRKSELARRHSESGHLCPNAVITISRRMGSGARVVAEKLSQELGWSLWDKELIEAMAHEAHVADRVVEAFDEKTVSDIEAFARSILGDYEIGGFLYPRHLARAVASIDKLGNAIILGRGANFLLPHALNIRIDASDELRVSNMMEYENLSHQEAVNKLKHSDKDRQDYLIKVFGRERAEHPRYDVSIWMDELRPEDAVEIILTTLRVWCNRTRSLSRSS